MPRLRQASMLREPQLTHVRQVASRPEVKQTAYGSGPSASGSGFPLPGASMRFPIRHEHIQRQRPIAAPPYRLARRGEQISQSPPAYPDRRAKRTFPTDRPATVRKERPSVPNGSNPYAGYPGSILTQRAYYFSCKNFMHWLEPKKFYCWRCSARSASTEPFLHSQAVLQGPGMGRLHVVKQKQKGKFMCQQSIRLRRGG